MNTGHNIARLLAAGLAMVALTACTTYDRRADNTLLGAGLGTAAGAVVSGGDPLYMLGGAAAGGLLGNVLTSNYRGGYSRDRGWVQDRGWYGNNYRDHARWVNDRRDDRRDWHDDHDNNRNHRPQANDNHRDNRNSYGNNRNPGQDHQQNSRDPARGQGHRNLPFGEYRNNNGAPDSNNH